jgi:hypothetical protein
MENTGKAQDRMSVSSPTADSCDAMPNTTSCVWASPAEAPQPTKAAKKRAKKAMKAALGEIVKGSDGIESIPLNGDSAKKAKEADEAKARQNVIAAINSDAADVARGVQAYAALCEAEDEAKRKRIVFADKMRGPALRKKLQNVRDFFATKKARECLTGKDGTQYFTAKDWVLGECGVTYEYVRRLDARFSGYKNLLEDGTPKAQPQLTDGGSALGDGRAARPPQENPPQEFEIVIADDPQAPQQDEAPQSASVDEKVRLVLAYADRFARLMTVDEKEEFYRQLSEKFRTQVVFPIDATPVFGAPRAEATV